MGIKWNLEYAWVKLNIFVLTPLVWIEQKWDQYTEWRLRKFVNYQIMMEEMSKKI